MNINSRRPLFHRRPQSNIYRMFLWVVMILGGVWILQQLDKGEIKPLFLAYQPGRGGSGFGELRRACGADPRWLGEEHGLLGGAACPGSVPGGPVPG